MKFCLLASGSRGNALWVEEGGLAILIDSGLSFIELKRRAQSAGLDLNKLSCAFVSHEHSDHISGLGPLARALKIPIYANQGTMENAAPRLGKVKWELFKTGDFISLGSFKIKTLQISHDCSEPVAFRIDSDNGSLGIATDVGAVTNLIRQEFQGLRALVLEFNHDYDLLMNGPYPWHLKQRVRSRTGHLSNEDASKLCSELIHQDLKHLILAHLSETNNQAELAITEARKALNGQLEPVAANQWKASSVFEL